MSLKDKKCLIACYSRRGENYVSGQIVNLPVGNTEVAAEMIRENTAGSLFQIDTVKPYPTDYMETTEVAKKELRENARPEISGTVEDMDSYDVVFLGYPNWWGTMPMAVYTFLESYNFNGKTVIPFCTHEGSGLGRSERDISGLYPDSRIEKGLAIHGARVREAGKEISSWLEEINI